jgi:hypothetical protein
MKFLHQLRMTKGHIDAFYQEMTFEKISLV